MEQCSAVESRNNIKVAECLVRAGIDFVCIPVNDDREALIAQSQKAFDDIAEKAQA